MTDTPAEEKTFEEDDFGEVPPSDIVAFNELRSCADLYRMYSQDILDIQPTFQRDVVWKSPEQTRFIDSLIKALPIPSMCFALDSNKQEWIVIDGLQRITSIIKFLEAGDWRLSNLEDIDKNIAGKKVSDIRNSRTSLKKYFSAVENLTIPVTVLRCDFSKSTHMEYLFTIFHRLNTGGTKLNNQEIRNGIYSGDLNGLLQRLDESSSWRRLNKMQRGKKYRYVKQEIILRFFAFYDNLSTYQGHLAKFLNNYMHVHRNPDARFLLEKEELFNRTIDCISEKLFDRKAPPKKLPTAILEALLVGVAKNVQHCENKTSRELKVLYKSLLDHVEFSEESRREGLAKKARLTSRVNIAINIFSA